MISSGRRETPEQLAEARRNKMRKYENLNRLDQNRPHPDHKQTLAHDISHEEELEVDNDGKVILFHLLKVFLPCNHFEHQSFQNILILVFDINLNFYLNLHCFINK